MSLILASTSRYRQSLLQRLQVPFDTRSPGVDENALPGEPPDALAQRLAERKATAIAQREPHAWVLGSDQVASLGGGVLGKPGNHARARAQLVASSGREVTFFTAVALVEGKSGRSASEVLRTVVRFRHLGEAEIDRYLDLEAPFDCAGSFKCEGLGIVLFDAVHSDDPTALEGLPLIATARLLRDAGFDPLAASG